MLDDTMQEQIVMAIAITAEATGTELKPHVLAQMAEDLAMYPGTAVLAALKDCRRSLRHRLTLADIIERVDVADGRKSPEEAWSIAVLGSDEDATIITNSEILEAYQSARPLLELGDKFGARQAFVSAYERITKQNRDNGIAVMNHVSPGHDPVRRHEAVSEALAAGMLTHDQAKPHLMLDAPPPAQVLAGYLEHAGRKSAELTNSEQRERCRNARALLGIKEPAKPKTQEDFEACRARQLRMIEMTAAAAGDVRSEQGAGE